MEAAIIWLPEWWFSDEKKGEGGWLREREGGKLNCIYLTTHKTESTHTHTLQSIAAGPFLVQNMFHGHLV